MNGSNSAAIKRLTVSSILYVALALAAAQVSILQNRPSEIFGLKSGLPALQDFIFGQGTAMTPPLYWLAAQLVLTALAARPDGLGTAVTLRLSIVSLFSGASMLGAPPMRELFSAAAFNGLNALLLGGLALLSIAVTAFGFIAWQQRRREEKRRAECCA